MLQIEESRGLVQQEDAWVLYQCAREDKQSSLSPRKGITGSRSEVFDFKIAHQRKSVSGVHARRQAPHAQMGASPHQYQLEAGEAVGGIETFKYPSHRLCQLSPTSTLHRTFPQRQLAWPE